MSADQIVLFAFGLIVIAAVAVTVAYATAFAVRGDSRGPGGDARTNALDPRTQGHDPRTLDPAAAGMRHREEPHPDLVAIPVFGRGRPGAAILTPASTRQVARVVSILFLVAVAIIVAVTRAWPDNEPAIILLLGAGLLLVVLFMDMIPPAALGRWRRPLEGIGAIIYLGLLMALTGGADSPFLVGFYLVVAGTALSSQGRAPIAVALTGSATIVVVGLLDAVIAAPLAPETLAWVGINAVALILLADIATAAARAQRHARDEALRASRFDPLTGLYNRAFFFTTMEQEIRRSDRMGRGFTMLMLDLDDLKPVNDTFGHQWGDRLLRAIADEIRRTIRFTDAAARYGGDEFVVLLPETDAAGGYVVGEKLRRDISALTLRAAGREVRSSVSVGLVSYPDDGSTIEQLVSAADVAMYEAKRRGKNRIVGYQTRTERVATDIDADTHELVQLDQAEDVRTGGDPAPWAGESEGSRGRGGYSAGAELPERGGTRGAPGSRRSERSTIPVESDEAGAAPWWTERASSEPRTRQRPDRSPGAPSPGPRPPDEPPEPPTRRLTAVDAPEMPEGPDFSSQPWLTRTDRGPGAPDDGEGRWRPRPASGTAEPEAGGESRAPQPDAGRAGRERPATRPAPDRRSSGGWSRSEEIRGGERPWIALPIEPDEPSPPPRG